MSKKACAPVFVCLFAERPNATRLGIEIEFTRLRSEEEQVTGLPLA